MSMRGQSAPGSEESEPDDGYLESSSGPHTWRIVRDHAERFRLLDIDWFRLADSPLATLVKRNGQRDVWQVNAGDRAYFAKIYHPVGMAARIKLMLRGPIANQEWDVGLYAAAHSVAAVSPVAVAWELGRRFDGTSLLVTEAVVDAIPLSDYWRTIRDDRHQAILLVDSLARLIARAHQCGFQHGDMHPGNVLVRRVDQRCEAFFVDLHRVCIGKRVASGQAVANLAHLNQWFRRNASRSQRLRFMKSYIRYRDQFAQASSLARNWPIDLRRLSADLAVQADRHANKLWGKRDRRAMRTSRYFARLRLADGWRGHAVLKTKHPTAGNDINIEFTKAQWRSALADPLAVLDPSRAELLKDSHTATICKAKLDSDLGAVTAVVKRSLARNAWKRLAQWLGPSRNLRAWRMANMLRNRDLPVATPLAVIEKFALGFIRTDSISVTEYVGETVDLEAFLTREIASIPPLEQRRVKDQLILSVVRLLKAFHERGFIHRDMKAPNLLVRWAPPYQGSPLLVFIDMDGISHRRRSTESQRIRAVVRLCASLLASPGCTASDRLRFLKTYLTGPGKPPDEWKRFWRRIHEEVCAKLAHKEVRREWKLAHYGRE